MAGIEITNKLSNDERWGHFTAVKDTKRVLRTLSDFFFTPTDTEKEEVIVFVGKNLVEFTICFCLYAVVMVMNASYALIIMCN